LATPVPHGFWRERLGAFLTGGASATETATRATGIA
jgi:hypothetical protein